MGRRGPAPLPSNVKKLKGTYRPSEAPKNEPTPEIKIPSRPSWLGKRVPWGREAIREWDRIAPEMERLGLLSELDRDTLAGYCDAHGRWWHFRREVAEHGSVQITSSGYAAQRPEVALMNRALDDIRKFSALFGFSPSDRARISVPEREDDEPRSKFASYG